MGVLINNKNNYAIIVLHNHEGAVIVTDHICKKEIYVTSIFPTKNKER